MSKKPALFFLVIVDEDTKQFEVHGPMSDDGALTDSVCDAQDKGRRVRCFSTANKESAIRWAKAEGLSMTTHILHRTL